MYLTTIVEPVGQAVTNDQVKANSLIRTDLDDDFIDNSVLIATKMVENYAKISVLPQTKQALIYRHEFEHHPHPELYFFIYPVPGAYSAILPRPPIVEITEVTQSALSEDSMSVITTTVDPSMYYLEAEKLVINVDEIDPTVKYFTATYTTGYTGDIPVELQQAIIQAVADHYDNRTTFVLSDSVMAILAPFRRQRIMSNRAHGASGTLQGYNEYYY